jgi:hypothetical protein
VGDCGGRAENPGGRLGHDNHDPDRPVIKIEAYCVKCKERREVVNPTLVTMKNGRTAAKGACAHCGTVLYKILSRECTEKLAEK